MKGKSTKFKGPPSVGQVYIDLLLSPVELNWSALVVAFCLNFNVFHGITFWLFSNLGPRGKSSSVGNYRIVLCSWSWICEHCFIKELDS